jgi:hypothetical protein
MEAEMKFYACIRAPMSFDWHTHAHGLISPESGLAFLRAYIRYPDRQRESKCVLAQGALSLYAVVGLSPSGAEQPLALSTTASTL